MHRPAAAGDLIRTDGLTQMSPDPPGLRSAPTLVGHADPVAGRHGVPPPDRRSHARSAAGARRRRASTRDAAQPWAAWLALRGFLALLVLAAAAWSVLLLTQSRGGIWPIIALAAGALSLAMIGLDVRARRRQRAAWRAEAARSSAAEPRVTGRSAVGLAAGPTADAEPEAAPEQAPARAADPVGAGWPAPGAVVAVDAVGGVQEVAAEPSAALAPDPVLDPTADPAPRPPVPELPRRRSHRK